MVLLIQVLTLLIATVSALGLSTGVLDSREIIKLFGRFADKELLLDIPGAGSPEMMNCCHGGCDNCAYSHVFDFMSAARAKWVPLYAYRRLVDGRSHLSPWGRIFSEEETDVAENNCAPLTRKEFKIRVQQLTPQMCMGPPTSVPHDEPLAEETLDSLWGLLAKDEEELTPSQMAASLITLSKQEHGAAWNDFVKVFS